MKNKLLFLAVCYFSLVLLSLISCERCGPFADKLKLTGLKGNSVFVEMLEDERSSYRTTLTDGDTLTYDSYGIEVRSELEGYFSSNNKLQRFEWINTAYACTPIEPTIDERIDSIVITSTKDFKLAYPAGTNLVDLFDVVVYDTLNVFEFVRMTLNDYLDSQPTSPERMLLILKEQPAVKMEVEFFVQYYQQGIDHDYFEFTTEKVVIE